MNRYAEMLAFVTAAEEGTLSAAARELQISPAMLGRRITSLEGRLDAKLLHRTSRHMSVTEQGAIFLERCRTLINDLESAEHSAFPNPSRAKGVLAVIAPAYFGRHHVAPLVNRFVKQHPDVHVSFDLTNNILDPVHAGHDLCIRIGNVIDPDFTGVCLAENRRVVCASPDYLERHGVPKRLQDLAFHDCAAVNLPSGLHRDWLFQEDGRLVSVKIDGKFDCNDGEVLAHWVRQGLCLAWRSTWEIENQLTSGELVSVLDEFALPRFDIYAIYPRARPLSANVELFIETLKASYAQPGYWTQARDSGS